jgi:multidrug efflux pump subunit AcrB
VISQRLETIPGVSGVQIWGQKRYDFVDWSYKKLPMDLQLPK